MTDIATYNFAYLDEQTKRMIRRAILKGIAIPGYQVPFASREMPMPYGWGTGGVQVTASIIGPDDVLKVIDQGADDTTNAVSIRAFFKKVANVAVTTDTASATIIQTRHRIPEHPLTAANRVRFAVSLDGGAPEVVDTATIGRSERWNEDVLSNMAVRTWRVGRLAPGMHTLAVHALDPGVVLDRIDVVPDGAPGYYGMPPAD